ncbi:hypothetical protein BU24DRAFT_275905 [Aaosphaeria arxii CBS 175.79]|uniref:Kinetochore protein mis14 n=1 Tax=Aaosphaeria arxii CBS 175.79 TaxID=1450172 RepID=A0A6A5XJ82_9PLEO|nr:uncharacterized protein BU24DRAFT_275905 [Aaosphaeria arxii CBS 175.79]KAF2012374.1 hypothetical protein BU24DRAFT_275905 [Aaosphaeria arxii CBS 175.79]
MDAEHRKIELQSPQDLTFLQSQIRHAALQKLDLHLPAVPSSTTANASTATAGADGSSSNPPSAEPDDLRRKTEELVNQFVAQVLEGMRRNISINGNDVVPLAEDEDGGKEKPAASVEVEEYEPYDEKLRSRLADLNVKRDALVSKISAHRRETPGLAAERYRVSFEAELERERVAREERLRAAGTVSAEDGLVVEGLKRADEVERSWERALEGLGRLEKGLPETRARLERSAEVVAYLNGKKSDSKAS